MSACPAFHPLTFGARVGLRTRRTNTEHEAKLDITNQLKLLSHKNSQAAEFDFFRNFTYALCPGPMEALYTTRGTYSNSPYLVGTCTIDNSFH